MNFSDKSAEAQIKIISQIVHKLPVGIIVINRNFIICGANEKVCHELGYSPHELYGEPVNKLLDDETQIQERHLKHLQKWFDHPHVLPLDRHGQLRARKFDGNLINIKITVFPLEHWDTNNMIQTDNVAKPTLFGSASIVF
jgi:PAS domain S-box-containing protein